MLLTGPVNAGTTPVVGSLVAHLNFFDRLQNTAYHGWVKMAIITAHHPTNIRLAWRAARYSADNNTDSKGEDTDYAKDMRHDPMTVYIDMD